MAINYANSELIDAYMNKQRVRTLNYRGSLLCTSIEKNDIGDIVKTGNVGSILYLTLIPFTATIKHFEFTFNTAINELAFGIGIAGINRDKTFTEIKDDILTWGASNHGANIFAEISDGSIRVKTLYELLCTKDQYKLPIDEFSPYAKDKYGVLYLKTTTKELTNNPDQISVNLEYVEASPSMALLTEIAK